MAILQPFKALRPSIEKVSHVAAVPYDVPTPEEAKNLGTNNMWSFLHVSRPEIDLPFTTPPYSEEVYQKASVNFSRMIKECPFIQEDQSTLYLYQLRMGQHQQTGIVGCFSLDEYDSGIIKKHEKTRPDKEDDRTRHILAVRAQTGPVFLAFRDIPAIEAQMNHSKTKSNFLFQFTSEDGIEHTVWKIPSEIQKSFATEVNSLYIADGHHRAAAASRVRAELAKQNSAHSGKEDYNFFLGVAFPASQLKILSYHRIVKELNGMTQAQFLEKMSTTFEVRTGNNSIPNKQELGMYLDKKWYRLRLKTTPSLSQLDVSILQENILEPILGITDIRTDRRIDFIGGSRGTEALEKAVDSGKAVVAFSLHPTGLNEVMEVSDRGQIMPPKSTWFEPKLRDGLFCHSL